MTRFNTRIVKRNNGQRFFRYEFFVWVAETDATGTSQIEHSFTVTKLGAKLAAKRAARKYLRLKKRATNPKVVGENTFDI